VCCDSRCEKKYAVTAAKPLSKTELFLTERCEPRQLKGCHVLVSHENLTCPVIFSES